ncbi:hypothetical protein WICPIJ_004895 [Wickerhamomyces pijperi]|uniref:Nucleoprotein TPR/MLP1 domain-containing protein n=1 Tax=Wickerhamomyces pijperi TaxID=599730 RepID=A0A9P8Q4V4_WICPI|nr:hypothetical protein WICPIJ_004895 [Wickerhamomyces pijperi]
MENDREPAKSPHKGHTSYESEGCDSHGNNQEPEIMVISSDEDEDNGDAAPQNNGNEDDNLTDEDGEEYTGSEEEGYYSNMSDDLSQPYQASPEPDHSNTDSEEKEQGESAPDDQESTPAREQDTHTNELRLPQSLEDLAQAAIDPFFTQLAEHFQENPEETSESPEASKQEIADQREVEEQIDPSLVQAIKETNTAEPVREESVLHPDSVEEAKETTAEVEDPALEVEENDQGEPMEEGNIVNEQPQSEPTTIAVEHETTSVQVTELVEAEQTEDVEMKEATEHSDLQAVPRAETEVKEVAPTLETAADTPAPTVSESTPITQAMPATQQFQTQQEQIPTGPVELADVSSFLNVEIGVLESLDESVLEGLQAKVREFRSLKSEKIVLEVKLEQSSHIATKKVDLFKGQLTKSQATNKDLKEQISTLEKSKSEIKAKLESLESQISESSSLKFQNLQQFDQLHSEKIRTLELLDKKNKEIGQLNSELSVLQSQSSELRKTIIELEASRQTANSNSVHSTIKIQSLETQIELINKNNEWLNKELSQMTQNFTAYRKEKSSEITALQTQLEEKTNELNSSKLAHDNLKQSFTVVSSKADSSLLKIKSLTDELASSKEDFFKEISQKDRLVQLLKTANDDAKAKISELEELLESSKTDISDHAAELQAEVNQYKLKLLDSESKVQELEKTIDELSTTIHDESSNLHSKGGSSSSSFTGSMFSFASKISGTSLNQLHSEFTLMQKQLALERRAKERLEKQINTFVAELEQKAPLINATKERASYLEDQLTELSFILEGSNRDKEALQKQISDINKELQDSAISISTLNRQKVDLARQVQSLLCQISVRGDVDGPLAPAEKQALTRIAKGDFLPDESDTDKLISERLVTFQNVIELQKKNEELLHVVRQLGTKLETEEKTSKSKLESLENQAILEAKEAILALQEEINSMESKLNSVTKERDMFRSMLSDKPSSLGGNLLTSNLSNHTIDGKQITSLTAKYEQAKADAEHWETQLKQLKVEYDTTINLLNKQVSELSTERYELTTSLAKERSSKELGEERFSLLQDNLRYAKSEADEIRKRSSLLQDNLAKQESRNQQITEEFIQSKSTIDTLRSENSNLKAEKQLWKSIESRLNEENTQLISERSRLNTLLLNLQSLEKTREVNASESQKRLLDQTRGLESELFAVREKLTQSSNELTALLSKKDSDSRVFQDKVDTLRSELSSAREQLIEKKNVTKTLQDKVISLTSKLHSAELLLSSTGSTQEPTNTGSNTSTAASPAGASSTAQLSTEALRLTRELEDSKLELEQANASVAKFKSIASATEDALNNITETFDKYKEATSQKLSDLETEKVSSLETIQALTDQLNSVTEQLSFEKSNSAKELQALNAKIKILQSKASSSETLKQEYDAKVAALDESYQEQVAIAQEAQKNYDSELQKHAQISKAVSLLREESNTFKAQIQSLSADAKRARNELESSRESWESQKLELEEELKAGKERIEDLNTQNKLLYNQIELLSKSPYTAVNTTSSASEPTTNAEELRELVTLLRREKEISDVQLEIATSDLQRVRHQAEIAHNELDTVKLELNKLKLQDSEREGLAKEHSSLLNEVEQLNLLRESNVTLRNELHSSATRITVLESQLADSTAKVQPLESQIGKLTAELQSKSQEMSLVSEEKNRWKQRSQDILSKYDRIDPQEHSELKVEVETLRAKLEEFKKSSETEAAKFKELSERYDRIRKEAQDKLNSRGRELRAANTELTEAQSALEDLKKSSSAAIEKLNEQLKVVESDQSKSANASVSELASLKTQLADKDTELTNLKSSMEFRVSTLTTEISELKNKIKETNSPVQAPSTTATEINDELLKVLNEKEQELIALTQGEASAIAEVEQLKQQVAERASDLKSFVETRILPAKNSTAAQPSPASEKEKEDSATAVSNAVAAAKVLSNAEINRLKSTIATKEKQIETLKQHEIKLSQLVKANHELTTKNASLAKELELLKQSDQGKGGKGKHQNIIKAKDLEISRYKEDLEKLKSSFDKKIQESLQAKESELSKVRTDMNKLRNDLNAKLQESARTKKDLSKEIDSLKAKLNASPAPTPVSSAGSSSAALPPIIEIKTDNSEWKTQLEKIKEQLTADFQSRYDASLESHKAKIRAPAEEKIQRFADLRAQKLEEEYEAKIKEATAKLEKQYASAKSSEAELEELKKKAFDEGREATKKEVAMRSKLLQAKTDKLNKEKKELEAKLKTLQDELAKIKSDTPIAAPESVVLGQKRPAEEQEVGSPEKKTKNE